MKIKSNTFQGNKSPCDSDCLFNNINPKKKIKKAKTKILLENCPIENKSHPFKLRDDHREVAI